MGFRFSNKIMRSTNSSRISGFNAEKSSRPGLLAAKKLTDHLGGVVDHGNDPGVVEPGRADNPQDPDDPAGGIVIRGNDGRGPRQREQLVFGTDENTHALGPV